MTLSTVPLAHAMGDDPVDYDFGLQPEPYAWAEVEIVNNQCVYFDLMDGPEVDVRECDPASE